MQVSKTINHKGMRSVSLSQSAIDMSAFTVSEIRSMFKKAEGWQVSLSPKVSKFFDNHPRAGIMLACSATLRMRKLQGKISQVRTADAQFTEAPMVLTSTPRGTDISDNNEKPLFNARANITIAPTDMGKVKECVVRQFATRASAIVEVKNDEQGPVVRNSLSEMPREVPQLNNCYGFTALAAAYNDIDTSVDDAVYKATMEAPMRVIANGTTVMYAKAPDQIRECLVDVVVDEGKDQYTFVLPQKARVITLAPQERELDAKNLVTKLQTILPGAKRGLGHYSSAHMDGIPLGKKWRDKLSYVTDVVDVDADVYLIDETDPVLINALRTILVQGGATRGIFYKSRSSLDYGALRQHCDTNGGMVMSVNSSFCIPSSSWPAVSRELTTCFISFRDPDPPTGKNTMAILDAARAQHEVRRGMESAYTFVQMYVDYRAMVFPEKDRGDGEFAMLNPEGTWDLEERYFPSARMGYGYGWYVTANGKIDGPQMLNAIASAIYQRVQYCMLPIPQREFAKVPVVFKPLYNFCVLSMKKHMPYVILGDESEYIEFYSEDDYMSMSEKLREIRGVPPKVVQLKTEEEVHEEIPVVTVPVGAQFGGVQPAAPKREAVPLNNFMV